MASAGLICFAPLVRVVFGMTRTDVNFDNIYETRAAMNSVNELTNA